MRANLIRALLLAPAISVIVSGCFGSQHPDYARYEYLAIAGVLQPPYNSYPSGAERGDWKCFDAKAEKEFDCTFVRGGWNQYQYVYRSRR